MAYLSLSVTFGSHVRKLMRTVGVVCFALLAAHYARYAAEYERCLECWPKHCQSDFPMLTSERFSRDEIPLAFDKLHVDANLTGW